MEETFLSSSYYYYLFLLSLITFFLFFLVFDPYRKSKRAKNKAPGPPSLPILGHLHLMKLPLHRSLERISNRYGPVISLQFGSMKVLVISSSSAVEECFGTNDIAFADRPPIEGWRDLTYNYSILPNLPYGPLWRVLRRISTHQILSSSRLNSFLGIRQEEVTSLVKNLHRTVMENGGISKVEMRPRLEALSFGIIMKMVTGKLYSGANNEDHEEVAKFRGIIRETFELSSTSDIVDFVPMLQWVPIGRERKRKVTLTLGKADAFLQRLIEKNRQMKIRSTGGVTNINQTKTIIDVMLELQSSDPGYYTDDVIKGLIMAMLFAGTDTSSLTLEWAMSLLLNNPTVLEKLKGELDTCVGQERIIEEHDINNLPYLQNVVTETLRLFPPAPLLLPHYSSADTTVQGFDVPKGTMLFANAWTIHRDPTLWNDPTSFKPERFELALDQASYAHKLLPFGLGRRSCPGNVLATKVVSLALGALIQCFEWERCGEGLEDLNEGNGLTILKVKPLEALCMIRSSSKINCVLQSQP